MSQLKFFHMMMCCQYFGGKAMKVLDATDGAFTPDQLDKMRDSFYTVLTNVRVMMVQEKDPEVKKDLERLSNTLGVQLQKWSKS